MAAELLVWLCMLGCTQPRIIGPVAAVSLERLLSQQRVLPRVATGARSVRANHLCVGAARGNLAAGYTTQPAHVLPGDCWNRNAGGPLMHLLCLVCMAGARLVPSPNSCVCMHLDLDTHSPVRQPEQLFPTSAMLTVSLLELAVVVKPTSCGTWCTCLAGLHSCAVHMCSCCAALAGGVWQMCG